MNYNKFSVDKNGFLTDLRGGQHINRTANQNNSYLEFVEVDCQNYKYQVENNHPCHKESEKNKKSPIQSILSALWYSLQWPQLKRQLSKEGMEEIGKRHRQKLLLLLLGGWLLFKFDVTPSVQSASLNYYPSSSEAILLPFPETKKAASISSETKIKFIDRFSKLAISEMNKFDIPASIILAHAILASNYGTSELAQSKNNYFQTTCAENLLNDGLIGNHIADNNCYIHCENAWTSFRANSLRLSNNDFSGIKQYAKRNYKLWLDGFDQLQLPYSNQLSLIIEEHKLFDLDLS